MEPTDYKKQALDFAAKHGVKLQVLGSKYRPYFPDDKESRYVFNLKLTRAGRSYTFTFGQSIAAGNEKPTMYDVLSCLTKYDPGTFEDFCGNFGYDTGSRSAERTYRAIVEEWKAMERLFTPEILEEMQEIQ